MAKKANVKFKNMIAFRLPEGFRMTAEALGSQLAKLKFHPCGSQEETSRGFVAPRGSEHDPLVHAVTGQYLITLQSQARILPGSVVAEAVAERAKQMEAAQGFKPGRKQLKELKEQIRQELLPKAFLKNARIRAWVNQKSRWLVIDAGSPAKADLMLDALANALENFPALRLNTATSPCSAMTDWLAGGEVPANFTIDRDCELKTSDEERSAVRYVRHSLEGDDVRKHLAEGKLASRLALTFNDRVSFVLTDKLEIKSLAILDIGEETDEANAEDIFDAEFTLMTGEYTELLDALTEALGGELAAEA